MNLITIKKQDPSAGTTPNEKTSAEKEGKPESEIADIHSAFSFVGESLNRLFSTDAPWDSSLSWKAPLAIFSPAAFLLIGLSGCSQRAPEFPVSDPKVQECIRRLDDPDPAQRDKAAFELRAMGTLAAPAIPRLIRALKDPSEGVRGQAARTLGSIGDASVVSELMRALRDSDWMEKIQVILALADLGEKAAAAVPQLILALKGEFPEIRSRAARALGNIGMKSSSALPELTILATSDPNKRVRDEAKKAISKIKNE